MDWRRTEATFLSPYRGPEGKQLPLCLLRGKAGPELPTPVSQPKGQGRGQDRAVHFSAPETAPTGVAGSTLGESARPRFEFQLYPCLQVRPQTGDATSGGCFRICTRRLGGGNRDRLPASSPLSHRPLEATGSRGHAIIGTALKTRLCPPGDLVLTVCWGAEGM